MGTHQSRDQARDIFLMTDAQKPYLTQKRKCQWHTDSCLLFSLPDGRYCRRYC